MSQISDVEKYVLLRATQVGDLNQKVNEYIQHGFQLLGAPTVASANGNIVYFQAVVTVGES